MASTLVDVGLRSWTAPGHKTVIEYSTAMLEEIRQSAVEGFNKLPHGGIEVGGVLFGRNDSPRISILAFRPLECEYALGPSFSLSERDQAALTQLIESAITDPRLTGMKPVGWYHSHTRSEICLTERDLALYNRFFPESWQIALVVRPANFVPTRAGFFFREPDGKIHADSTYAEFTVSAESISRTNINAAVMNAPVEVPQLAPVAPPPPPASEPKRRHWKRYVVAAACGVGLALAIASAEMLWERPNRGGATLIDPGQLRIRQLEMEAELLRQKLAEEKAQTSRLEQVVTSLQTPPAEASRQTNNSAPPDDPPKPVDPPAPKRSAERQPQTVAATERAVPAARTAAPARFHWWRQPANKERKPPELTAPPMVVAGSTPVALPRFQPLSAPAPPEKPAVTQVAGHTPAAPSAGRLIWTGRLPKNGTVIIDGKSVSSGALTGELPSRPVRMNVYPADLTTEGLVLHSANIKYAKNVAEAAGPQNGWQQTLYTWSPHHAADVAVAEAPGPRNNWNRVVLRSRNSTVSVIVIDWTAQ